MSQDSPLHGQNLATWPRLTMRGEEMGPLCWAVMCCLSSFTMEKGGLNYGSREGPLRENTLRVLVACARVVLFVWPMWCGSEHVICVVGVWGDGGSRGGPL